MPSDDTTLGAFWRRARTHAGLSADLPLPEAWSFGATPQQADDLLALVIAGCKTATSSARRDYEIDREDVPDPGPSIIIDGAGAPRVLIMTTDVQIVPFARVDAAHAEAEGERDLSLEAWREIHREAFALHGPVTDDLDVVLERFAVLYVD